MTRLTHYIVGGSHMPHALVSVFDDVKSTTDRTQVTCEVCLALTAPTTHLVLLDGLPLHTAPDTDAATGEVTEVNCQTCLALIKGAVDHRYHDYHQEKSL